MCIRDSFDIEVYSGTEQLSFLSPRGGKYIEIPRGVRNRHGVLSFGGTYMAVSYTHLVIKLDCDAIHPCFQDRPQRAVRKTVVGHVGEQLSLIHI